MPTEAEIAWAAGLFEGEGCIHLLKQTSVRLSIEMTDSDVLERFMEIVGAGAITDKTCRNPLPQWKARFQWYVNSRNDVQRILLAFQPWLHSRRGAKATEALARLTVNPGANEFKTHCKNGHEFTPENIYYYEGEKRWRRCKKCHRDRANARYHRRKVIGLA